MAIFAVTAPLSNPEIGPVVEAQFSGDHIKVWQGLWFISAVGTAKEIYEKIEATLPEKKTGSVIVLSVINYWGFANPEVWEWIKSRLEKK